MCTLSGRCSSCMCGPHSLAAQRLLLLLVCVLTCQLVPCVAVEEAVVQTSGVVGGSDEAGAAATVRTGAGQLPRLDVMCFVRHGEAQHNLLKRQVCCFPRSGQTSRW